MQSNICTRLWKSILISIPLVLISYHSFAGSPFPKTDTGMILLSDFCKENVRNLAGYSENEKSLAMIISRSYICTNGDDEPEDPPFPVRLSKSCSIVSGVAHLFSNEEKLQYFVDDDIRVVASHGVNFFQNPKLRDFYKEMFRIDEVVPVFTHKDLGTKTLSSQVVRDILEGRVTDWTQIGANGGKIRVHLNGSSMQRQAFLAFLERSGIEMGADVQTEFAPNYDALEVGAIADSNSISFGIGGFEVKGLTLVKIDGLDPRTHKGYPLILPIYYGVRGTEAYDVFGKFVRQAYGHR